MPNVQQNVDLLPYNTMRVQSMASNFVEITSVKELDELARMDQWSLKKLVLGGGSNMLLVHDFDGLVIRNRIEGKHKISETDNEVVLKVGAGEDWHDLVVYCVEKGLGGIENLSLIPGTVGAAPIQNIGAYGVELQDVFHSLEAFHIEEKKLEVFTREQCEFGYRDSIFKSRAKGKYLITSVTLILSKRKNKVDTSYKALKDYLAGLSVQEPTIKDISEAVIAIRQSKLPDPRELGNCGSFFKNPVITNAQYEQLKQEYEGIPGYPANEGIKVPAGWLIEQSGLKGIKDGEVGTYPKQALVLVNYGEKDGEKVWEFAQRIQSKVAEKFGILLQAEVNII